MLSEYFIIPHFFADMISFSAIEVHTVNACFHTLFYEARGARTRNESLQIYVRICVHTHTLAKFGWQNF